MAFQVQFFPKQIGCKSRVISVLYSITNIVRWRLWTLPFDFARLSTILLLSLLIDFWSVPKIIWPIFEGHQSKPSQENIFLLNITENQFVLDFLAGAKSIWENLSESALFLVLSTGRFGSILSGGRKALAVMQRFFLHHICIHKFFTLFSH